MFSFIQFMQIAKNSNSLQELYEKVEKSGSNAYIGQDGNLYTGIYDEWGFIQFTAYVDNGIIKCVQF